jgi:hypothetical protein
MKNIITYQKVLITISIVLIYTFLWILNFEYFMNHDFTTNGSLPEIAFKKFINVVWGFSVFITIPFFTLMLLTLLNWIITDSKS